jgi:hypothetical protein
MIEARLDGIHVRKLWKKIKWGLNLNKFLPHTHAWKTGLRQVSRLPRSRKS